MRTENEVDNDCDRKENGDCIDGDEIVMTVITVSIQMRVPDKQEVKTSTRENAIIIIRTTEWNYFIEG